MYVARAYLGGFPYRLVLNRKDLLNQCARLGSRSEMNTESEVAQDIIENKSKEQVHHTGQRTMVSINRRTTQEKFSNLHTIMAISSS